MMKNGSSRNNNDENNNSKLPSTEACEAQCT